MEAGFNTPSEKIRPCNGCHTLGDEVCSVCLSPIEEIDQPPSSVCKGGPVQTKCKHTFHQRCLLTARRWKSECPMCRNTLSPIVQQLQWVQSNSGPSREEIAQTASRVRNAMRIGIARRLANAAV